MVKYKIAIDTLGSDGGVAPIIRGAVKALNQNDDLGVVLFGDGERITSVLRELKFDTERVEIVHAPEAITNYDNPMEAIFKKTESSLVKGLTALGERDDVTGLINAGSTGALLAGALRYVPARELKRPALAAILPAERGGYTCLVDTGASIDCSAGQLLDFAYMGAEFMKKYYGIDDPRIGLLSNGAEPTKGNKLVKETHILLKDARDLNFVGNIEGTNALSGDCDVLVTDGFAGNQIFKSSEGMARRLITDLVKYAKRTGSGEVMQAVGYLMQIYDFNSLGGGVVLGVGKPVIKVRGTANEDTIANTSAMLLNMAKSKSLFEGKDIREVK